MSLESDSKTSPSKAPSIKPSSLAKPSPLLKLFSMTNQSNPQPDDNQAPLEQTVKHLQRTKEEELTKTQAAQFNLEYRNLNNLQPDPAAVAIVPKELVESAQIFAFEKTGTKVMLALTNPNSPATLTALKQLDAMDEYQFQPVLVSDSSIRYVIGLYDTFAPKDGHPITTSINLGKPGTSITKLTDLKNFQTKLAKTSTSDLVELIFAGATGLGASDIHIEPTQTDVRLRYRLDGVLQDIATLPKATHETVLSRIKLLATLKLNIKESSQDGRFSITAEDEHYDIRVSVLPTQYGESVVMRLLPQTGKFVSLDELGLSQRDRQVIDEAIHQPNGLILNTGPTGSGKTTTLYAVLNTINSPTTKIITVEDPIEYQLNGVTQTQVNPEENYDFANALRAIVRQDPDIILVGEIRDQETADIAVNASLTGHLVLSTLHTNDAAGAVPRLIDLGAKPQLFSDALRLIIAQRLVRKVCPNCKASAAPDEAAQAKIKSILPDAQIPATLPIAKACDKCNGTGYQGRVGIFELLEITPEIKVKIMSSAPAHEIQALA